MKLTRYFYKLITTLLYVFHAMMLATAIAMFVVAGVQRRHYLLYAETVVLPHMDVGFVTMAAYFVAGVSFMSPVMFVVAFLLAPITLRWKQARRATRAAHKMKKLVCLRNSSGDDSGAYIGEINTPQDETRNLVTHPREGVSDLSTQHFSKSSFVTAVCDAPPASESWSWWRTARHSLAPEQRVSSSPRLCLHKTHKGSDVTEKSEREKEKRALTKSASEVRQQSIEMTPFPPTLPPPPIVAAIAPLSCDAENKGQMAASLGESPLGPVLTNTELKIGAVNNQLTDDRPPAMSVCVTAQTVSDRSVKCMQSTTLGPGTTTGNADADNAAAAAAERATLAPEEMPRVFKWPENRGILSTDSSFDEKDSGAPGPPDIRISAPAAGHDERESILSLDSFAHDSSKSKSALVPATSGAVTAATAAAAHYQSTRSEDDYSSSAWQREGLSHYRGSTTTDEALRMVAAAEGKENDCDELAPAEAMGHTFSNPAEVEEAIKRRAILRGTETQKHYQSHGRCLHRRVSRETACSGGHAATEQMAAGTECGDEGSSQTMMSAVVNSFSGRGSTAPDFTLTGAYDDHGGEFTLDGECSSSSDGDVGIDIGDLDRSAATGVPSCHSEKNEGASAVSAQQLPLSSPPFLSSSVPATNMACAWPRSTSGDGATEETFEMPAIAAISSTECASPLASANTNGAVGTLVSAPTTIAAIHKRGGPLTYSLSRSISGDDRPLPPSQQYFHPLQTPPLLPSPDSYDGLRHPPQQLCSVEQVRGTRNAFDNGSDTTILCADEHYNSKAYYVDKSQIAVYLVYYICTIGSLACTLVFGYTIALRTLMSGYGSEYSQADGWDIMFQLNLMTNRINDAMCKLQMQKRCSGGGTLCPAPSYSSVLEAYNEFCPYCPTEQPTIATFTRLCPPEYKIPKNLYGPLYLLLTAIASAVLIGAVTFAVIVNCCLHLRLHCSYEENVELQKIESRQTHGKRMRTEFFNITTRPLTEAQQEKDEQRDDTGQQQKETTQQQQHQLQQRVLQRQFSRQFFNYSGVSTSDLTTSTSSRRQRGGGGAAITSQVLSGQSSSNASSPGRGSRRSTPMTRPLSTSGAVSDADMRRHSPKNLNTCSGSMSIGSGGGSGEQRKRTPRGASSLAAGAGPSSDDGTSATAMTPSSTSLIPHRPVNLPGRTGPLIHRDATMLLEKIL